jgi:hypothetical protein
VGRRFGPRPRPAGLAQPWNWLASHASGTARARAPTGHPAQRAGGGAADDGDSGNEV